MNKKQELETVLKVYEEWGSSNMIGLITYCKSKVAELSKPQYCCISNAWPFEYMKIGDKGSLRHFHDLSQFPFHWELIKEEEVITRTREELEGWAMKAFRDYMKSSKDFEYWIKNTEMP